MASAPDSPMPEPVETGGATSPVDDFLGTNPGPAWRRRLKWIAVAVAAIALIVLVGRFVNGGQATHYASELVERGDVQVKLFGTGRLQPVGTRAVGTRLAGTVAEVLVKDNDRVIEGEILARIDPAPFQAEVDRVQQLIDARQAALDRAQAAELEARTTLMRFERVRRHSGGSVPSDREMDAARRALGDASDASQRATVELASARADLTERQAQLAATEIRSPMEGMVARRQVAPGQYLAGTAPNQTLFMIALPYSHLRLDVAVNEADAQNLARVRTVQVTTATVPGRSFPATVKNVGGVPAMPQPDRSSTRAGAPARPPVGLSLDVANPDLSLRPGMVATAQIDLDMHRDVLIVPNAALRFARASDAQQRGAKPVGPAVYVLGGDATPHRVPVTVDGSDGNRSIVQSDQLSPSVRVITGLP